jgi:uncharacterized protein YuzE
MKGVYLEVTYRRGKPLAAYLNLDRRPDDVAARTEKVGEGLLLDRAEDGRPIGIEIASPRMASVEELNRVLESVHHAPVSSEDLAPLSRPVGSAALDQAHQPD